MAAEGFADRHYEADGSLTPRTEPDAVIHDAGAVVARAVRMAREGVVISRDGEEVPMRVATICTHGDTPGSHSLPAVSGTGSNGPASRSAPSAASSANRGAGSKRAAIQPHSNNPRQGRHAHRIACVETVAATPLGRFAVLGMNPPAIAVAFLQTAEGYSPRQGGGHP